MTGARRVVATEVKDKREIRISNGDVAIAGVERNKNADIEIKRAPLKKKNSDIR